ncbi:MAG: prolipoprotein diacylglyceryl transferase [Chloroflexi bacterium]|nr:prolipoprotein diacylglyceryl transferase [Chloroflexota bacterium]
MLPTLRVFGLSIQAPLLAIMVGFMLGLWLTARLANERNLNGNLLFDAGFYGLLAGVIGARIGYVFLNFQAYAREPLSALMPSITALQPEAGWFCGVVFAVIFLWRNKMLRRDVPDIMMPGVVIFATGLALGAFFNGDAFGIPAQLPWSIYLWGEWRHPVQLYELAGLVLILAALLIMMHRRLPAGAVVLAGIALVACLRVFVDGFRADVATVFGLRVTQLAGVVIAVTALWLLGERLSTDSSGSTAQAGVDEPALPKKADPGSSPL